MRNYKPAALILSLLIIFSPEAFPDSSSSKTPEPYEENEFPSWSKDLRRAEIITLGSMPFITFNVSLGYSFGSYASHGFDSDYFVNPFASGSDSSSYTQDEQIGILLTSIGISTAIGLTDFIVHTVKHSRQRKKARLLRNKNISVESITEDPEATKLPPPPDFNKKADEELEEAGISGFDNTEENNEIIIEKEDEPLISGKKTEAAEKN